MIAARLIAVASIAIILLTAVEVSRAEVSPATYPLGSMTWTLVSTPKIDPQSGGLVITYKNNLNTTLEGIVHTVVHNSIGQTLAIEATTLNMMAGQTLTTYNAVWYNVGSGNYTTSVFATSFSGVAISNSTSVSYYI
jgi:hypothetical protein